MSEPQIAYLPASVLVDGDAVRRARKALGVTAVAFAPTIPMSFGYLCRIERNDGVGMSPPMFKALAKALGFEGREQELQKPEAA